MILTQLLNDLKDVPERLDYHPEGNTFTHTQLVCLRAYHLVGNRSVIAAALLHDICKGLQFGGTYKTHKDGYNYWSNKWHPKQAEELILSTDDIRYWIHCIGANIDLTVDLVANHMRGKDSLKKVKHIPFIDMFLMCDDMVARKPIKSYVWGYHDDYKHSKLNYAGFAPIDRYTNYETYTITIGRTPIRKSIQDIDSDLPNYITEVYQ